MAKENKELIYRKIKKILAREHRAMSMREITIELSKLGTKISQPVIKGYIDEMIDKKVLEEK